MRITIGKTVVEFLQGDVTAQKVDAIVNAASWRVGVVSTARSTNEVAPRSSTIPTGDTPTAAQPARR